MKKLSPPHRRALVALLPTLLVASPALAQEAPATAATTTQPAPPVALPQLTPAPAPEPVAVADPVASQSVTPPQATAAEPSAVAEPAARPAPRAVRPRAVSRPAPVAVTPRAASPAVASPAVSAPTASAPAETTSAPAAPVASAPETPAIDPVTTAEPATPNAAAPMLWPWILGGIVVLGALFALLMRRKRGTADFDEVEQTYAAESVVVPPVAEPLAAAPPTREPAPAPEPQFLQPTAPVSQSMHTPAIAPAIAMSDDEPALATAEHSEIVAANPSEVDALTAGTPPVADRPWIELAIRPVRAGTGLEEAVVEIELTVGNAGSVAANDVRIATFLFAAAPADDAALEHLLIDQAESAWSEPRSIGAGEGTRVDATLALPRSDLGDSFNPVVVADVRYVLADGSEGRTSASFTIGLSGAGDALAPIENDRREMHHDVEARLEGVPEHA